MEKKMNLHVESSVGDEDEDGDGEGWHGRKRC